jgi:hypothetical protein
MYTQVPDRGCPPNSMCQSGYCQPPNNPQSCNVDSDCASSNGACQPFLQGTGGQPTGIVGYCAPGFGTSVTSCGTNPTAGFNATCKSGQCISTGSSFVCLVYCKGMSGCPGGETCAQRMITIEGYTTRVNICG